MSAFAYTSREKASDSVDRLLIFHGVIVSQETPIETISSAGAIVQNPATQSVISYWEDHHTYSTPNAGDFSCPSNDSRICLAIIRYQDEVPVTLIDVFLGTYAPGP